MSSTNHPLTREQYDAFLQIMERDGLSIRVEFNDKGEAWNAVVEECKQAFGWSIDPENHPAEPEIPFRVEHADELEVKLEEGQVT